MSFSPAQRGLPVSAAPLKKRSKAQEARDLRRAARHNRELQDGLRLERSEEWAAGGRDGFLAARQEGRRVGLEAEKLRLRGEVRDGLGVVEGRPFIKGEPGGRP